MSSRSRETEDRERGRPRAPAASPAPSRPDHAGILALQRSAGNRVVAQVIVHSRQSPSRGAEQAPAVAARRLMRHFAYVDEPLTRKRPGVSTGLSLSPPPEVTWTGRRPTSASGPVHGLAVPDRDRTATALAYKQTGAGKQATYPLLGYDGGHVIGLHLGGENVSANVVPMFPGFNRGVWKNMEDATKTYIALNPGKYRFTVTMTYGNPLFPEVPATFTVVREVEKLGSWTEALPPVVLSQPDDIAVTEPLSEGDQETVTGKKPVAPISYFIFSGDQFETGGLGVTDYVNKNGHMPPSTKAHYPDLPKHRPYELLDILVLNRTIKLPVGGLAHGDFSAGQRALIIQTNMARNGGKLKSDDPHDPQQDLDEQGAANAPEVDHIVPKSRGGSNYFSNARLVSWQLNNSEDRVKSLKGLVDLGRLALPTLPNKYPEKAAIIVEQAMLRLEWEALGMKASELVEWAVQTFNSLGQSVPVKERLRLAIETELGKRVTRDELVAAGVRYMPKP